MSAKRALVVDDSKSARVVLSRMLEKFGIEVDTADSAEGALEYLKKARPDVVFMDHLMPGMDGLQAVKIIKADPNTATIPVMMYTSQEGELYVGQARALGAMGVLPKTVKPIDVTKVLYQLRLLPDRRDFSRSALQPVSENGEVVAEPEVTGQQLDPGLRGAVEALLKEQSLELRRFVVAALDSHAQRLIAELRPREPAAGASGAAGADEQAVTLPPEEPPMRPWGWVAAAALFVALGVLGVLYWQSLVTAGQVEQARVRLEQQSTELAATLARLREATPAGIEAVAEAVAPRQQVLAVPYGELPLAPARLEAVRALVADLERDGFRGVVRVETVPGVFCLTGNAEAGYSLAEPAIRATQCDHRGNPFDEALSGAARQPIAFANLAASLRRRTAGGIELQLVQAVPTRTLSPYPDPGQATAGAWNNAALANSRLEVTVLPR
jgi:CheY-like chemotaxis protein